MSSLPPMDPPTPPAYHHGDLRRTLMAAAAGLIAEQQGWSFSLREVARRAGVSHNAPFRHFADKGDLLAALAVAGHETLTGRMHAALSTHTPAALIAIGVAYVGFATENPARYRLMFGPELRARDGALPAIVTDAAARSKALLTDVVRAGARAGQFGPPPDDETALEMAVLSAWAIVHGLAMLTIDGMVAEAQTPRELVAERVTGTLLNGLLVR